MVGYKSPFYGPPTLMEINSLLMGINKNVTDIISVAAFAATQI